MAFLFHIGFSNSSRLSRRTYYFEYRTVRYKLVQNASLQWADTLLTIVPDVDSPEAHIAYSVAGEFLSALSWANHAAIGFSPAGGAGFREGMTLRRAGCRVHTFPATSYRGRSMGYDIGQLPEVQTDEQRLALALMREARATNSLWLAVLLLWQVIEIGGTAAAAWITRAYRRGLVRIAPDHLRLLALGSRGIGEYFEEDCRNAIAHIRRKPGKRVLDVDQLREFTRLSVSSAVLEAFAEAYIRRDLRLDGTMWLVQVGGRGFPTYKNTAFVRTTRCRPIRDPMAWKRVMRMAW